MLDWVEIDHGMGGEAIPFLRWKVRVARSESGVKVIFEYADRTFGIVVAVGVRGDKLEFNVVYAEELFHCVGALVVEEVESEGCIILM